MSMVQELRNDINNNKLTLQKIVRKAYTMAKLLKLNTMATWLDYEMNGYDQNTEVPYYRNIQGKITNRILTVSRDPFKKPLPKVTHPIGSDKYILRDSIHILEKKFNSNTSLKFETEYTRKYDNLCILISNEQIYKLGS